MLISVDLDGTLTTPVRGHEGYEFRKPNEEEIGRVNECFRQGHTVVIHTARPWADYGVTKAWLRDTGVWHHELVMGKPLADLVVDDFAITSLRDIQDYNFQREVCGRIRRGTVAANERHMCFFCGVPISVQSLSCSVCGLMPCPGCGKCFCKATWEEKVIVYFVHRKMCMRFHGAHRLSFDFLPGSLQNHPIVPHCVAAISCCAEYERRVEGR